MIRSLTIAATFAVLPTAIFVASRGVGAIKLFVVFPTILFLVQNFVFFILKLKFIEF